MDDTNKENLAFASGLQDIVASITRIVYIDGQAGKLVYRGYDINELAEHSTYEETVFLLLYGKLPDHAELSAFNEKLISYRHVTNLGYRYRLNRGHREMLKKFVSLKNGF